VFIARPAAARGPERIRVQESARVVAPVIELVLHDLAAERVAVYAEDMRRSRLIAVGAVQNALDETLLEFSNRFVEKDAAFHHLHDKPF
jgi:hypothetical protein